jgi:hypothetical protein
MGESDYQSVFEPWIGPCYDTDGIDGNRLLLLGESHYGDSEDERPEFTQDVVRKLVHDGRHRFFTILAKLLLGMGKEDRIDQDDREWVWDRIAFHNYVQGMAGQDADGSVPDQLWERSEKAFYEVVRTCEPDGMVVVGKGLSRHLPDLDTSPLTAEDDVLEIPHVSRGFSYDPWGGRVQQFIENLERG